MIFKIIVNAVSPGWEVSILDSRTNLPLQDPESNQPLPVRSLGCLGQDDEAFPVLPENPVPADWTLKVISDAYYSMMNQTGGTDGVQKFGLYLFHLLLGEAAWKAINQTAGAQPIELALFLPVEDRVLNRLPWEIMHTGQLEDKKLYQGFLAAEPDVAITRRVDTQAESQSSLGLPSPLKVLFVVGSSLTDENIRSGAEYFGLLRNLESKGLALYHRLLLNASTASLEEQMLDFRPDIVHIICHGNELNGETILEMRHTLDETQTDYVNAERLMDALAPKERKNLPLVLILNACSTATSQTATSDEVKIGRPLAAEMVQKGIPIVLGMSGQIADQACRLFARCFYETLIRGGDIARAAARGRRAALAHGVYNARSTIDWGLPSLFLAANLSETLPQPSENAYELQLITRAMDFINSHAFPAFCGRLEFFRDYDRLIRSGKEQSLFIAVPIAEQTDQTKLPYDQYGRSRLLRELAAQALRDGHFPILLEKEWLRMKGSKWPSDFKQFLMLLIEATSKTLQVLQGISVHKTLYDDWDWQTLPRFIEKYPESPPTQDLPGEFNKVGLQPIQKLAKAFRWDLLSLLDKVAEQRKETTEGKIKLILLVDDAQQFIFNNEFFALLGKDGLEEEKMRNRARCVVAYNSIAVDGQQATVQSIKDEANEHNVIRMELNPLHEPIDPTQPTREPRRLNQATLIYKHFLFHWQDGDKPMPLALNHSRFRVEAEEVIGSLAEMVNGIPSRFTNTEVSATVRVLSKVLKVSNVMLPADDEAALGDLSSLPGRG